ncbi:MAG: AI-2E family transporter [candidate division KSB1 bacterium]
MLPGLVLGVVLLLLSQLVVVALHLAAAVAGAATLEPLVRYCTRRKIPRALACFLALVLLAAFVAALLYWLTPIITKDLARLNAALNASAPEKVATKLSVLLLQALPWLRTKSILQQLQAELTPIVSAFMQAGLALEVALLSSLASYVIVAAAIFYLLQWGERTRRTIVAALPNRQLESSMLWFEKVTPRLGRFARAQVLFALGASMLLATAFSLMGLRGVFLMSVFGALTLLTPYWGALAGAVPLLLAGLNTTNSLHAVFGIMLALATLQLLANIFWSTARFKVEARLQPLEALLALLVGGSLGGVWGLVLAGPLAGISKILLQEAAEVRKSFRG